MKDGFPTLDKKKQDSLPFNWRPSKDQAKSLQERKQLEHFPLKVFKFLIITALDNTKQVVITFVNIKQGITASDIIKQVITAFDNIVKKNF